MAALLGHQVLSLRLDTYSHSLASSRRPGWQHYWRLRSGRRGFGPDVPQVLVGLEAEQQCGGLVADVDNLSGLESSHHVCDDDGNDAEQLDVIIVGPIQPHIALGEVGL